MEGMTPLEAELRLKRMMNDQPGGGFSNHLRAAMHALGQAYLHADLGNRAAMCALDVSQMMRLYAECQECPWPRMLEKAGMSDERAD